MRGVLTAPAVLVGGTMGTVSAPTVCWSGLDVWDLRADSSCMAAVGAVDCFAVSKTSCLKGQAAPDRHPSSIGEKK
jgi:hypothetical protein